MLGEFFEKAADNYQETDGGGVIQQLKRYVTCKHVSMSTVGED
jgi:hypothetical protein